MASLASSSMQVDIGHLDESPQIIQLLEKQKKELQDAQSRKGEKFVPASKAEQMSLIMFHQMIHASIADRGADGSWGKSGSVGFEIRTTFIPPSYAPCTKPVSSLTKLRIRDLLLEYHHRGRYMLIRSVTPPNKMNAIMTVVQDEEDEVLTLQVYYLDQGSSRPENAILREGAMMIVKEPYLKRMSDGNFGIRVDHLSDLIFLEEGDERIPISWRPKLVEIDIPAATWKERGNNYFKANEHNKAIECYTKALRSHPSSEESVVIRLNRSLCYLRTRQYDDALGDLESICGASDVPEKALFRKSQALYGLERFPECSATLVSFRQKYPANVAAREELSRAIQRMAEKNYEKYNFKKMYMEVANLRPPLLDHATFVGPVTVKPAGSKGRGLFTTKAVKAGDLLLCEKAFAYAFADPEDMGLNLLINSTTNVISKGTHGELLKLVVQKLRRNSSLIPMITDLHHGSDAPPETPTVDSEPVIDSFLIGRIISLNAFGGPTDSSRDQLLKHVKSLNKGAERRQQDELTSSSGVWPIASAINHSCVGNARRSFIGDIMIIRATQNLAENTELSFPYVPWESSLKHRKILMQHWGFECVCPSCEDHLATSNAALEKRKMLIGGAKRLSEAARAVNMNRVEGMLTAAGDTYHRPASQVPRRELLYPYSALGDWYMLNSRPNKAVHAAICALESCGYILEGARYPPLPGSRPQLAIKKYGYMTDSIISIWMLLRHAYNLLGATELSSQAAQHARMAYKICVGEDETFDELRAVWGV